MTDRSPFLRGTLELLILRALQHGRRHGYDVVTHLADRSDGTFRIEDGALYQALHRMRERGWVSAEWGRAESGKRARFYELTSEGRQRLESQTEDWHRHADAVRRVLGEP